MLDASLFNTHHLSEAEILCSPISAESWREHNLSFTLSVKDVVTRGDVLGILLAQVREQQAQIAELRRINGMLSEQLRVQREQGQLRAQPAPQPKPLAKIIRR